MGIPREPSSLELRVRELAESYIAQTEAYDRTVCSSERDGVAMPSNGTEYALIADHARQVLDRLTEAASPLGVGRLTLMREIQRINRS